jgi:hypothetical protein
MITSSPTISQPPSPNTTFHTPSHRPYHASRRTSASSSAHSPRFAVTTVPSRRFDAPPTPKPTFSAPSPVPTFAPSPQSRKRAYVDSSTQYSPSGFPPTYRPQPSNSTSTDIDIDTATLDHDRDQKAADPTSSSVPAIAPTQRGDTSAAPVVTEPPEPQVRVSPQPITPAHNVQPQGRRMSHESTHAEVEPTAVQKQGSTVLQVPASPSKRARPAEPGVKVMPLQYETCDVKDLGVLISDMLMELVRLNDGYLLRDGALTRFHSRCVRPSLPGASLADTDPSELHLAFRYETISHVS